MPGSSLGPPHLTLSRSLIAVTDYHPTTTSTAPTPHPPFRFCFSLSLTPFASAFPFRNPLSPLRSPLTPPPSSPPRPPPPSSFLVFAPSFRRQRVPMQPSNIRVWNVISPYSHRIFGHRKYQAESLDISRHPSAADGSESLVAPGAVSPSLSFVSQAAHSHPAIGYSGSERTFRHRIVIHRTPIQASNSHVGGGRRVGRRGLQELPTRMIWWTRTACATRTAVRLRQPSPPRPRNRALCRTQKPARARNHALAPPSSIGPLRSSLRRSRAGP